MGFLADVGRSNLLGQVMEYGRFTQQTQQNQLQQQVVKAKLAEEERLNRPMLLSELVGKGSAKRPNSMKIFSDTVKMMGLKKIASPDGQEDYIVTQKDLPQIAEFMKLQKDLHPQQLFAARKDNLLEIDELEKQRGKGNAQEEMARVERIEQLKKENANILFEIQHGKEEGEPVVAVMGNDGKPVYVPRSEAAGKEPFHQDPSQSRQYKQFIGSTEDGSSAVIFDARSGDISTKPFPGGVLPGVKGKKSLPAQEADTLGGLKTTHENIKLVRDAFHENLTGAYQGRLNEFLQAFQNNPEFESLRRRVNRLITVAYDLSGKQISEKEIQILQKSILPQVEQMDENFLQSLEELEDWIVRVSKNKQDAFDKAHYDYGRVSIEKSNTPTIKVEPPPMEYFDGEGSIVKDDITGASWQLRGGKPTRIK